MSGQKRVRLGLALALGTMLVSLNAVPASGATRTIRFVDDNPKSTACHHTNFHTIQAAINASNAADVVYVCPGWYHESLVIDVPGLVVQATKARKAHLIPPADSDGAAVVMLSRRSELRGLSIEIPAENDITVRAGGSPSSCGLILAAVVVLNTKIKVVNNAITATGQNTLSGECGYLIGILAGLEALDVQVTQGATAQARTNFLPLGPGAIKLKRNYIRDFKLGGILAGGEIDVRVLHNAIRFVHRYDEFTCVPVNTVTARSGLVPPCEPFAAQGVNPLNGILGFSIGIGVGLGAHADILYNQVFSTLDLDIDEFLQMPLLVGIATLFTAEGSRVSENVVTQSYAGIAIDPGIEVISGARPTGVDPDPSNVDVTFNRANEGFYGILVDGTDNYVYANRTRLNFIGLATEEGFDNFFEENDSRFNFEWDCLDDTGDDISNIDNLWIGNVGNTDFPDGICESLGSN